MRRASGPRLGAGLLGTAPHGAVIAGSATAVAGRVAAGVPGATPQLTASAWNEVLARLSQLEAERASGVLTDGDFEIITDAGSETGDAPLRRQL